MMTSAVLLLLGVVSASASLTSTKTIGLIKNVRINHMSWTTVDLYWDWASEIQHKPQFAVSYVYDGVPITTISPKCYASLAVRPAHEYQVEIRALWADSGATLESKPTTVNLTALVEDWPTPRNVSYTLVEAGDDSIVYSFSWDQEVLANFRSFMVQICSRSGCDRIYSKKHSLRVSLEYAWSYRVIIFSDYNVDPESPVSYLAVRESPELSFVTDSGEPSRVRDLDVIVIQGEDGFFSQGDQFLEITWTQPDKKRGPLSGYVIQVSNGRDKVEYTIMETHCLVPAPEYHQRYDVLVRAYNDASSGLRKLGVPRRSWIRTPFRKPGSSMLRRRIGACMLGLLVLLLVSTMIFYKNNSQSRSSGGAVVFQEVEWREARNARDSMRIYLES